MSETKPASRWSLWLPLAIFLGFVGLVMFGLYRPADREVASAMIGKPLPEFALRAAVPD
ncbi:MAG: DsbE family thiol:disulfide interchange protein, partial [Novosphingobium sp.]